MKDKRRILTLKKIRHTLICLNNSKIYNTVKNSFTINYDYLNKKFIYIYVYFSLHKSAIKGVFYTFKNHYSSFSFTKKLIDAWKNRLELAFQKK